MPKTPTEKVAFTLLCLALASAFIAGLVWAWSWFADRPPLEVVINWAPAIVISLGGLVYTCMKQPRR